MLRFLCCAAAVAVATAAHAQTPCVDGRAGPFECDGVTLQALVGIADLGYPGGGGNDVWGWTDPQTGREYALIGSTGGTSFVDVTEPAAPVVVGRLDTRAEGSGNTWRDVKTVGDHAYVVSEVGLFGGLGYGIQVFDLTRLRDVASPPVVFDADALYEGFGHAHNIVALPERGLVAGVLTDTCGGGFHFVDVSDPLAPAFAGCVSDGRSHDGQCVIYTGPDPDHQGSTICVGANESFVSILDATDLASPVVLSRAVYPNVGYTHQGWFTEDQRYFLLNDEGDETGSSPTRTLVFDFADLDNPVYAGHHDGTTPAIDHNLYTRGDLVFQANYHSGLRVLEMGDLSEAELTEVAFFDTVPGSNAASFGGAWSVYPYFPSGTVVVSDTRGLYVLTVDGFNPVGTAGAPETAVPRLSVFPNPAAGAAQLRLSLAEAGPVRVEVFDVLGRRAALLHDGAVATDGLRLSTGTLPAGTYVVRARGAGFVATERLTVTR